MAYFFHYILFMIDEMGSLEYFIEHKLLGIFTDLYRLFKLYALLMSSNAICAFAITP